MPDGAEQELLRAIGRGDASAFERLYEIYSQRLRLVAWKVCHRGDWVDDVLNESWCRAFDNRRHYDSRYPFLVWLAGIVRNVYREQARKSPVTLGDRGSEGMEKVSEESPEGLAAAAELLVALNDCMGALGELDARIMRLKFFEDKSLRVIAAEVGIPESTVREVRIPAAYRALRQCLATKGIVFSELFGAQEGGEGQ